MHKTGLNDGDILNIMFPDCTNKNFSSFDRSETPESSPPKLFKEDPELHQQEREASVIQEVPPTLSPAPPLLKPIPLMQNTSALLADLFTPTVGEVLQMYRRLPLFASWTIADPKLNVLLVETIRPKLEEWVNEFARDRLFSIMPILRSFDELIVSNMVEALKRFDGKNLPGLPSPIDTSLPFPLLQGLPPNFNIHQQILNSIVMNQKMTQQMLPNPLELLSKMGLPKEILCPSIVSESMTPSLEPLFKVPKSRKIVSPKRQKAAVPAH